MGVARAEKCDALGRDLGGHGRLLHVERRAETVAEDRAAPRCRLETEPDRHPIVGMGARERLVEALAQGLPRQGADEGRGGEHKEGRDEAEAASPNGQQPGDGQHRHDDQEAEDGGAAFAARQRDGQRQQREPMPGAPPQQHQREKRREQHDQRHQGPIVGERDGAGAKPIAEREA